MPKRKSDHNVENLLKKIKKLQKKMKRKCRSRSLSVYSSTSSSEHEEQPKTGNSSGSNSSEKLERCSDSSRPGDTTMDTEGGPSTSTSSKDKPVRKKHIDKKKDDMDANSNAITMIGITVFLVILMLDAVLDVLKVREEEKIRRKLNPDGERRQSLSEYANKKTLRRESRARPVPMVRRSSFPALPLNPDVQALMLGHRQASIDSDDEDGKGRRVRIIRRY